MDHAPLSIPEIFGLRPYGRTLAQARMVFAGDPEVPPTRFDRTSLAIMTPRLSIGTWLGHRMGGRVIPLLNLFNHNQTPTRQGWSVRISQVRDFRGLHLTYDSHNGTDFVIPPGTLTVSAAPGQVVSIRREFNRGGLKIYVDHGRGLITTYNHLGRALVSPGERVARGQPIAMTGYSGIDGLTGFPWLAPHVHWNVILGGRLVDPFARPEEVSLWRDHNDPRPFRATDDPGGYEPTSFSPERVEAMRSDRKTAASGADAEPMNLLLESTIYPTRFHTPAAGHLLYEEAPKREPRLTLPFLEADFDGVGFADEMGFRSSRGPKRA